LIGLHQRFLKLGDLLVDIVQRAVRRWLDEKVNFHAEQSREVYEFANPQGPLGGLHLGDHGLMEVVAKNAHAPSDFFLGPAL